MSDTEKLTQGMADFVKNAFSKEFRDQVAVERAFVKFLSDMNLKGGVLNLKCQEDSFCPQGMTPAMLDAMRSHKSSVSRRVEDIVFVVASQPDMHPVINDVMDTAVELHGLLTISRGLSSMSREIENFFDSQADVAQKIAMGVTESVSLESIRESNRLLGQQVETLHESHAKLMKVILDDETVKEDIGASPKLRR